MFDNFDLDIQKVGVDFVVMSDGTRTKVEYASSKNFF